MNVQYLLFLFVLTNCLWFCASFTNNVCKTYDDYYTMQTNSECAYDPAADLNATDVIKHYGYPLEVHKVITANGYILTLFRIPNSNNNGTKRNPVLLHHALLNSAASYLALQKHSLAFLLANENYDVWLGNNRGNEYSNEHLNCTIEDKEYWNFSVDDLSLIDIPAEIDYIASITGQKGNIVYIGHSIGTTMSYMYASEFPEHAKANLKLIVSLAPAHSLEHTNASLLLNLKSITKILLKQIKGTRLADLLTHTESMRSLVKNICLQPSMMPLCMEIMNFYIIGPPSKNEPMMVPVMFNQACSSISLNIAVQELDLMDSQIRRYNHEENNFKIYGRSTPPLYNVSKIEVPVFIYYSASDWLNTKQDAVILHNLLQSKGKIYGIHEIKLSNFNHGAFVYSKDAKTEIYDHLIKLLKHI